MIRLDVGGDDLSGFGDEVAREMLAADMVRVRQAQRVLFKTLREMLSRKGTGREYASRRARGARFDSRAGRLRDLGGRFVTARRRASAPGEPPAPDTGSYRDSITEGPMEVTRDSVSAEVYTDDPRGPWLEYGTRRMAARPHFRPALEQAEPEIDRILR